MMEFAFEESAWELYSRHLEDNDIVSASRLLTLLEEESEESVENAFQTLEELTAQIDLSNLPKPQLPGETGIRLKREAELVKQGALLKNLDDTDPLRIYLEELASIPVCGDIVRIASDLAVSNRRRINCSELRTAAMNLSLSRVVEIAQEYTGWGILLLDLIQEGSLGLWKATECFVGLGEDFESARDWRIRFYISKAVVIQARASGVGQKMRQAAEDYRAVDQRLLTDLGRNPTMEEIAAELHMTLEEAELVAQMLENARTVSRVKAAAQEKEPTPDDEQAVEDTAYFRMRQRITELLSVLDEKDAKLLTLRFGLEGGLPLSPEETGRKLGLTPEEVVAAEAEALAKLRSN